MFSTQKARAPTFLGFLLLPTLLLALVFHTYLIHALPAPEPQAGTTNTTAPASPGRQLSETWPPAGINCEGSHFCERHVFDVAGPSDLSYLNQFILQIPDASDGPEYKYASGAHIACKGADWTLGYYCVFPEGNTASFVDGFTVRKKMAELLVFGCRRCGSVPLDDSGTGGVLKMDYVTSADCVDHLCEPTVVIPYTGG